MNLWFVPQISEHCPYRKPDRLIENLTWFNRPGVASVFTPVLVLFIFEMGIKIALLQNSEDSPARPSDKTSTR
jgi:hypothetical protein